MRFNSTEDSQLKIEVLNGSSDLVFNRLEYRVSGSWVEKSATVNGDTITADWSGSSNPVGRIVFNVSEFDRYKINISIGGKEITAYNPGKSEQQGFQFSVNNPSINYALCAFTSNFWSCNPSSNEPGYKGETFDLGSDIERIFNLPANSQVDDFSIELSTVESKPIMNLTGEGVLFTDITSDSLKEVLTFVGQTVEAYDSSGNSIWSYTANNQINDIESGDEKVSTSKKEVLAATENSLLLLSNTGNLIWSRTGNEFYDVATGELSSESYNYKNDDGNAEDLACIGCSTNASRITLPFNFQDVVGTHYVETGVNYYERTGDLKFKLNGTIYDIDESQISEKAVFEYDRSSGQIRDL
ncbi:MAG: hypothetical protein ABEJ72_03070, partial [Candidatus Aenigmatarchaeota archaeon]